MKFLEIREVSQGFLLGPAAGGRPREEFHSACSSEQRGKLLDQLQEDVELRDALGQHGATLRVAGRDDVVERLRGGRAETTALGEEATLRKAVSAACCMAEGTGWLAFACTSRNSAWRCRPAGFAPALQWCVVFTGWSGIFFVRLL